MIIIDEKPDKPPNLTKAYNRLVFVPAPTVYKFDSEEEMYRFSKTRFEPTVCRFGLTKPQEGTPSSLAKRRAEGKLQGR